MPQKCGAQAFGLPPLIHNVTPFYQHVESLQNTVADVQVTGSLPRNPLLALRPPPELDPHCCANSM